MRPTHAALVCLATLWLGCDGAGKRTPPSRSAEPRPRVLVFTRPPEDGKHYAVTKELAASSGSVRTARDRLIRDAERQGCRAVEITEEWQEDVPDADGDKRFFVRARCLVERE